MTKITYLLGAGASCDALPLAKEVKISNEKTIEGLPNAMMRLGNELVEKTKKSGTQTPEYIFCQEAKEQFDELAKKSMEYNTVDTYAKYLSLTNSKEFDKLKVVLSKYFIIEEYVMKKFDKRYLVFLTTILNELLFPKSIKLLTWNYDFQLEIAASYFFKENIQNISIPPDNFKPLVSYFPNEDIESSIKSDFDIVHLNGIANRYSRNESYEMIKNLRSEIDALREYMSIDRDFNYQIEGTSLYFAWDNHTISDKAILIATEIIKETDILVVIGYSFPFFNRSIDKKLFEVLKQNPKLRIYFQDPYSDGLFLKNQFELPEDIKIEHVSKVDQFYVPHEL